MSDKEFKQQIRRVKALVNKWTKYLGMLGWKLEVTYDRMPSDEEPGTSAMCTSIQWEYQCTCITFFCPVMCILEDEVAEEVVIHELMHVMLSPMAKKRYDRMEEFVATTLSHSIQRTWAYAIIEGSKI